MKPLALALILAVLASPAAAHRLKLFATVEGQAVTGYAFFVGGGRAQGSDWTAQDAGGARIAAGKTDPEGRYRFTPPAPVTGPITVTVDTHEGHVATARVAPERFGAPALTPGAVAPPGAIAARRGPAPPADIAPLVEAAVQRQIEPLLERIEQMDSRMRVTDVMSGLFLIIGLAGAGLWLRGRRR